jgi:hypothetical protein
LAILVAVAHGVIAELRVFAKARIEPSEDPRSAANGRHPIGHPNWPLNSASPGSGANITQNMARFIFDPADSMTGSVSTGEAWISAVVRGPA